MVKRIIGRFFGFSRQWVDKEEEVLVSDLERTVLDGLMATKHCGGIADVAKGFWMRRSDINVGKLVAYARRLDIGSVVGRLGYLMEVLEIGTRRDLILLRRRLGRAYARLDPLLPPAGKFLARWRLRLNVTAEEIRAGLRT